MTLSGTHSDKKQRGSVMKTKDKAVAFLGKDTEFEGTLSFHGDIRIDGHFKGEISEGGNLIVGEEGLIEANMHVAYIVISGEVHGNIIADQRVDIHPPGKVFGDIQAPAVVIDEGVIFEGKTRMYQAKGADEGNFAAVGSDEYAGSPPHSICAIYGIITDQNTGKPIKNAEIICDGVDKKHAWTNTSGYYELINLEDGNWKLKIKAKGYKNDTAKVAISEGGTHEKNIELRLKK
jgi:cytoskeletal protein CcmA (bactofilin family)